ncbi:hypothetical protein LR48_Vigan09g049400 [Vigna angularis]|uniref:Uncharacterized protein n=1 Tax=Phaseolus angularis TaxID=3914 RepID=A0A0L9V9R1_PHAAN|nr:hypothetical protein LR48_Vigan09g049400 [Vigna angularis]
MPLRHSSGTRPLPSIAIALTAIVQHQDKRSTESKTKRSRHPLKVAQPGRPQEHLAHAIIKAIYLLWNLVGVRQLALKSFGNSASTARPSVASSVPAFFLIDIRSLGLDHAWSHVFKHSTVRPFGLIAVRQFSASSVPAFGHSASRTFGLSANIARPPVTSSVPSFGHSDSIVRPSLSTSVPPLVLSVLLSTVRPFAASSFPTFGRSASYVFCPSTSTAQSSLASAVKTFNHSASLTFGHSVFTVRQSLTTSIPPLVRSASYVFGPSTSTARSFLASAVKTFNHSASLTFGHSVSTVRQSLTTSVPPLVRSASYVFGPSTSTARPSSGVKTLNHSARCTRRVVHAQALKIGKTLSDLVDVHPRTPRGPSPSLPYVGPRTSNFQAFGRSASKVFALWLQPLNHPRPRALSHSTLLMLGYSASTVRPFGLTDVRPLGLYRSTICGLQRSSIQPHRRSATQPLPLGYTCPHGFKHSIITPFAALSVPAFCRSASHLFGPSTSTARSSLASGVKTFNCSV